MSFVSIEKKRVSRSKKKNKEKQQKEDKRPHVKERNPRNPESMKQKEAQGSFRWIQEHRHFPSFRTLVDYAAEEKESQATRGEAEFLFNMLLI